MSDLVERLRENSRLLAVKPGFPTVSAECSEAADRIEELERDNAELREEVKILSGHLTAAIEDYNDARREALEEAAAIAETHGRHLRRGDSGLEYVNGNRELATAIRALSDSTPTLLQEQKANSGKEGE